MSPSEVVQASVTVGPDVVTGHTIIVIVAVDRNGKLWQKVADKPWECLNDE